MRIIQFLLVLLDKIVAPLLVAVLTPITIGIVSKINSGDWMKLFGLIPNKLWIVFGLVIFLWIVIIVIRRRIKQLQKSNAGPRIFVISTPPFGWINIGKLNYAGVVWRIRASAPPPWESFNPLRVSPSSIEVETPPRCPECETELEESQRFWGGYIWKCVGCGFLKKNRDSYYKESKRAEKIARRKWEKQKYDSSGV